MPKSRRPRRRPSTPDLNHHHHSFTADPASPPDTPTTSPQLSRKISLKPRHQPPFHDFAASLVNDPNIKPVGNGHQFSYQPALGPEQLSPRSSSSSSVAVDSADDGSSESASVASLPNAPSPSHTPFQSPILERAYADSSERDEDDHDEDDETDEDDGRSDQDREADSLRLDLGFIQELDPIDSDWDTLEVICPYEIESIRSRSSSWHKDLDRSMMRDLKNLHCSNETSDNEADVDFDADLEEEMFLKRQQELRRIRRVSMSSSVGKRTHSELSDSEDDLGPLDVNDVGSSARHMRKRLHRSSLLFQDPPEQIEELEEPNSSEDEDQDDLARELPYWDTMEIVEVDSS